MKFDPQVVTHVISDLTDSQTLRLLGCKKPSEIPITTRIVRWTWFTNSVNTRRVSDQLQAERFPDRIFEAKSRIKGPRPELDGGRSGITYVYSSLNLMPG